MFDHNKILNRVKFYESLGLPLDYILSAHPNQALAFLGLDHNKIYKKVRKAAAALGISEKELMRELREKYAVDTLIKFLTRDVDLFEKAKKLLEEEKKEEKRKQKKEELSAPAEAPMGEKTQERREEPQKEAALVATPSTYFDEILSSLFKDERTLETEYANPTLTAIQWKPSLKRQEPSPAKGPGGEEKSDIRRQELERKIGESVKNPHQREFIRRIAAELRSIEDASKGIYSSPSASFRYILQAYSEGRLRLDPEVLHRMLLVHFFSTLKGNPSDSILELHSRYTGMNKERVREELYRAFWEELTEEERKKLIDIALIDFVNHEGVLKRRLKEIFGEEVLKYFE